MSTETVSTLIATPPTAAPPRPVRRTVPPALLRAGRSRAAATLVLAALGLASGVLLVQQLGSVDLFGTLADASPVWLAVAAAASIVPFVGAALSLMAFAPGRLPLRRTTAVQVASSYAGLVLPPSVGQVAVNARFLHRLGHGGATVTATVALTQVSGLVVTLVLLAVALAASSATVTLTGTTLTVAVVLLGAAAAPLLVSRVRRAAATAASAALTQGGPRIHDMVAQPARLVAGTAGSLLVTSGYVATLDASLRAVGTSLSLAETAVVVLAGTALGSAAPTPGGTVAVEAALTGGLVAAGVPAATALPAVLVYRAVTLWMRVAPGWVTLTALRRRGVL